MSRFALEVIKGVNTVVDTETRYSKFVTAFEEDFDPQDIVDALNSVDNELQECKCELETMEEEKNKFETERDELQEEVEELRNQVEELEQYTELAQQIENGL